MEIIVYDEASDITQEQIEELGNLKDRSKEE